jgi:hypothetical protein
MTIASGAKEFVRARWEWNGKSILHDFPPLGKDGSSSEYGSEEEGNRAIEAA